MIISQGKSLIPKKVESTSEAGDTFMIWGEDSELCTGSVFQSIPVTLCVDAVNL